jgi:hypothetical protein
VWFSTVLSQSATLARPFAVLAAARGYNRSFEW